MLAHYQKSFFNIIFSNSIRDVIMANKRKIFKERLDIFGSVINANNLKSLLNHHATIDNLNFYDDKYFYIISNKQAKFMKSVFLNSLKNCLGLSKELDKETQLCIEFVETNLL